jgi:hypothetical protein
MKKEILFFIIIVLTFLLIMFAVPTSVRNGLLKLGCNRPDRIERQDSEYIYVWEYNKEGDSTLLRYRQPVYREFKVMGGHHKNHHIKVDWDNDGRYDCCQLPYDGSVDRCGTVDIANKADAQGKPVIGVFKEVFYPHHYFVFIRYK